MNKKKKLLLFILIFLFHEYGFGNPGENKSSVDDIKNEVAEINKLILERSTITYSSLFNLSANLINHFPDFRKIEDSVSYIYRDENDKVRKFITMTYYPEFSGYNVHYFNPEGQAIFSYIYNQTYMSPHFYGYRYMSEGKQLYCDMNTYNEEEDSWSRISYNNGEIIQTYTNSFDYILHVDSIAPFCNFYYQKDELCGSPGSSKVKFISPEKGRQTILSGHNVNLRERPTEESKIIFNPIFGERVKIINKEQEQDIPPYGKHHWFHIEVYDKTGYIFGAFLEPVEQIIE